MEDQAESTLKRLQTLNRMLTVVILILITVVILNLP